VEDISALQMLSRVKQTGCYGAHLLGSKCLHKNAFILHCIVHCAFIQMFMRNICKAHKNVYVNNFIFKILVYSQMMVVLK
jgi:hypothetical protein